MNHRFALWYTVHISRKSLLVWGIAILLPLYIFIPFALLQFFCVLLLFILIGSRIYSEYLVRKIHIRRQDLEFRVFRYEWVQVEIKAENYGLLPAFMLIMADAPGPLPVFRNNTTFCNLGRRSWIFFSWQGHCTERGVFTLGPVTVHGADPLGLFPFQLVARETSHLFVYPVVRSIILKNPTGIPLGNMISSNPLFEDITRRRSLRPYQKGDDPRRINWKLSARKSSGGTAGSLMVNEYDATASYPVMIFLNVNRDDYPIKKQGVFVERSIEAAAALCLKVSRERQELGIIIYTSHHEGGVPVIAPAFFTIVPILERLAALDWAVFSGNVPLENSASSFCAETSFDAGTLSGSAITMLEQGKKLPYGTRYLYTGPDLGDEAYIRLNTLKKHHITLEYLIIDDRSLPSLVPGNSIRHHMKENGHEIV
jgi:uncharacterized protein (DUF58 family)